MSKKKRSDWRALITITEADELDYVTAHKLAQWLRHKADEVEADFMQYAPTFRMSLMNP